MIESDITKMFGILDARSGGGGFVAKNFGVLVISNRFFVFIYLFVVSREGFVYAKKCRRYVAAYVLMLHGNKSC